MKKLYVIFFLSIFLLSGILGSSIVKFDTDLGIEMLYADDSEEDNEEEDDEENNEEEEWADEKEEETEEEELEEEYRLDENESEDREELDIYDDEIQEIFFNENEEEDEDENDEQQEQQEQQDNEEFNDRQDFEDEENNEEFIEEREEEDDDDEENNNENEESKNNEENKDNNAEDVKLGDTLYSDEVEQKTIIKQKSLDTLRVESKTPPSLLSSKISQTEYYVGLGNRVFFESYDSTFLKNTIVFWDFGDGKFVKGQKSISHLYTEAGNYTLRLKLVSGNKQSVSHAQVYVAKHTAILLSDGSTSMSDIHKIQMAAQEQNAYLRIISVENESNSFALEEKLTRAILTEAKLFEESDYFISLTAGNAGINAFSRAIYAQNIDLEKKQLIALTQNGVDSSILVQSIQNNIGSFEGANILALGLKDTVEIFKASPDKLQDTLLARNITYTNITQAEKSFIHPFNFLSKIISMLLAKNIAPNVIVLILMLPIAATIVVVFRQIIGISSFGIFTPALLAITFLATGIVYGLAMFFIILIAGVGLRLLIQNMKLLSIPRISIVMIFVSFIMLLLLGAGAYFDYAFVYSIGAFPMLILASVIEKFVTTHVEKGFKDAIILLFSTLLISIISYFVMNWQFLQTFVLAYPEMIFLLIIVNILLGKWTGMRVLEYMRFKVLINKS